MSLPNDSNQSATVANMYASALQSGFASACHCCRVAVGTCNFKLCLVAHGSLDFLYTRLVSWVIIVVVHVLVCSVTQCLQSTVKFCKSMQLSAREAAVERLWEPVIVDPTNSLTNYHFYSGENNADRCSYAYWQPQGNTTETHSEIVRTESIVLACCQHFE